MGTSDSSQSERVRHVKERTMAIFRSKSLRQNGTYPAEQRPTNIESIRQMRTNGQRGYTVISASGSVTAPPCC